MAWITDTRLEISVTREDIDGAVKYRDECDAEQKRIFAKRGLTELDDPALLVLYLDEADFDPDYRMKCPVALAGERAFGECVRVNIRTIDTDTKRYGLSSALKTLIRQFDERAPAHEMIPTSGYALGPYVLSSTEMMAQS